jgi:hypothetical protein
MRGTIRSVATADRCNAKEPIKAAQAALAQGRSAQQLHAPVIASPKSPAEFPIPKPKSPGAR